MCSINIKNMDFKKLKELINSIPEEQLDCDVEITFITDTKTGNGVKIGYIEGVLFVDDGSLKLIGKEGGNNW